MTIVDMGPGARPGRRCALMRREVEKLGQHRLVRRFAGAKMPHVAPPGEELGKLPAEGVVELRRLGHAPVGERRGVSNRSPDD